METKPIVYKISWKAGKEKYGHIESNKMVSFYKGVKVLFIDTIEYWNKTVIFIGVNKPVKFDENVADLVILDEEDV